MNSTSQSVMQFILLIAEKMCFHFGVLEMSSLFPPPPSDFISICRSTAPDVCHTSVCLTFKAFLTDCSDT